MARRTLPASRMYQATLPLALHSALRREAQAVAKGGGQVNLNKSVVRHLYLSMRSDLSPADRKAVEDFLARL